MNQETADIHRRKSRGAVIGAAFAAAWMLAFMAIMLWVNSVDPMPAGMLALCLILPGGALIGTAAALFGRLKEIEKGEEDEASKY